MNYEDGDFVKIIEVNGKESFGLLMKCDERDIYRILILSGNFIKEKVNEECETILCKYSDGRFVNNNGLKIIVDKIKNKFLLEELRQAYNLYVE